LTAASCPAAAATPTREVRNAFALLATLKDAEEDWMGL
jgi:hypothetical protein